MMPHERVCIDLHDICIGVQGMRVTSQSCGYTRVNCSWAWPALRVLQYAKGGPRPTRSTDVHLTQILIVSCTQSN